MDCVSLSVTAWSCAVQCVLCRNCSAHQVLVVFIFPCDSSSCTRCVLDLRHGARNGSRKPHVFISSHVAELVFVHGSAIACVGEPLRQTERALVVERLARQAAKVA